jgi:hypothetical protein
MFKVVSGKRGNGEASSLAQQSRAEILRLRVARPLSNSLPANSRTAGMQPGMPTNMSGGPDFYFAARGGFTFEGFISEDFRVR